MDGDGVQQAFCTLLWRANGGEVDKRGQPIFRRKEEPIRGYCTRAYDCYTCSLMQEELRNYPPDHVTWVCPDCASHLKKRARGVGAHLVMPGFYTEGYCQSPFCRREPEARLSPILQVVIGDIRKEGG